MVMLSRLAVSDSVQPHGLWPTRLPCPWNFSDKNTGVGCHALLQGNLPDPGIKPVSPACPAMAGGLSTTEPLGKPQGTISLCKVEAIS